MSISSTQAYLIDISNASSTTVFNSLMNSNLPIELLNPLELGGEWVEVSLENNLSIVSKNIEIRNTIESAIKQYYNKSFFSFLIDEKDVVDQDKIDNIKIKQDYLLDKVNRMNSLNALKSELSFAKKLNLKSGTQIWAGEKLNNIEETFQEFVDDILFEFKQVHPEENLELELPSLHVNKLEIHEIITVTKDKQNLFGEFIHQTKLKYSNLEKFINELSVKINNLETEIGIINGKPNHELISDLKLLHTQMEIEDNFFHFQSNIFSPFEKSQAKFIFINVPNRCSARLEKVLTENNITFQKINWNQEVIDWKNNETLTPFQNITQSLGTASKTEIDPSIFVTFFFVLFFSMALNDALYGLIIALFTGYFIYFAKLKKNFKDIFNLFFLGGIGSIAWGALSNSWAGNLFANSAINPFLESFQIINPLKLESNSIVNQILINNGGISPIVVLLGFSILIGLVQITTAYLLKTVNAFKREDSVEGWGEISWLIFIYGGIAWMSAGLFFPIYSYLAMGVFLIGLVGMFIFNHGKGFGGKILSGLIKLYELIAFLADLLSYTRLVAIGLTGAIIAEVINLLANLVASSSGPIIGFILGVVILIIGHTFNIVVGLFGAYINPLRLHYVEFLPKFFSGKARNFKPLLIDLKYVYIK
jgi:vacuolar-type H+-ATPase subunit I/STV1